MKAKYNGFCKVTGQKIVAGETEIEKVNGQWQAVGAPKFVNRLTKMVNIEIDQPLNDGEYEEMVAETEAYESQIEAAANDLNRQFPEVPASTWMSAIRNIGDPFGRPVRFSSIEKQNAFDAMMKKYNL